MSSPPDVYPKLLAELAENFDIGNLAWEVAATLLCLLLGWAVARVLKRRYPESFMSVSLVLPLVALIGVSLAGWALGKREPVPLLHIMQVLLATWLIVRATAGLVLHVFPQSAPLRLAANIGKWIIWIAAALYVMGLLGPLTEYLDSIHLPFGKPPVSLQSVIEAGIGVVITLIVALWFSAWLEGRLLRAEGIEFSLRLVLTKLLRALMLAAAVLVAMGYAGIPLTALSVFGGALGVGLGLGLQRLAANYVSGFVILLERSIKVGDNIRLDGFEGQVSAIRTRYTLVKAPNGREAIVPNETLVSSRVENLSLANPNVLCSLTASCAYESDVDAALRILVESALAQPRVLQDPAPGACISAFAPDGFELTLMFWINDPENGQLSLKGAIFREVWSRFCQAGIEVPYPQRVVRGNVVQEAAH
jgi:small-conductance mechanosensitive channel